MANHRTHSRPYVLVGARNGSSHENNVVDDAELATLRQFLEALCDHQRTDTESNLVCCKQDV